MIFTRRNGAGKVGGKMGADSIRRTGAILLVILGGASLWWAGNGAPASASANDATVATIAAARERAAANDPRLKGASRLKRAVDLRAS